MIFQPGRIAGRSRAPRPAFFILMMISILQSIGCVSYVSNEVAYYPSLDHRRVWYPSGETRIPCDVFRPADPEIRQAKVAVMIPGGGWWSVKSANYIVYAEYLCSMGYRVYMPKHRTLPRYGVGAAVEDIGSFRRWLESKANRSEISEPELWIAASAGGHLLLSDMIRAERKPKRLILLAPVTSTRRSDWYWHYRIPGVFEGIRWVYFRNRHRELSPAHQLPEGFPAFVVIQGTADRTVPPGHSALLVKEAERHRIPCEYIILKGEDHDYFLPKRAGPGPKILKRNILRELVRE